MPSRWIKKLWFIKSRANVFLENAAISNIAQGKSWFIQAVKKIAKASKNFDRLESGGNDATHVAQGLDLQTH